MLTPLELIARIAALVPSPRTHRHRYFGVLAPNALLLLCAAVTALAQAAPVHAQAPRTSPARGPPLWDDCDAQAGEAVDAAPDWDVATQAAPDYEVDQHTNW